jgi:hypothetical protein
MRRRNLRLAEYRQRYGWKRVWVDGIGWTVEIVPTQP